jgi:hypothetical protein
LNDSPNENYKRTSDVQVFANRIHFQIHQPEIPELVQAAHAAMAAWCPHLERLDHTPQSIIRFQIARIRNAKPGLIAFADLFPASLDEKTSEAACLPTGAELAPRSSDVFPLITSVQRIVFNSKFLDPTFTPENRAHIATHEFGHILGLPHLPKHPRAVMHGRFRSPKVDPQKHRSGQLTSADLRLLRKIHGL